MYNPFSAPLTVVNGHAKPRHVLLFRSGFCRNSMPVARPEKSASGLKILSTDLITFCSGVQVVVGRAVNLA